jgi:hypothetical protein
LCLLLAKQILFFFLVQKILVWWCPAFAFLCMTWCICWDHVSQHPTSAPFIWNLLLCMPQLWRLTTVELPRLDSISKTRLERDMEPFEKQNALPFCGWKILLDIMCPLDTLNFYLIFLPMLDVSDYHVCRWVGAMMLGGY